MVNYAQIFRSTMAVLLSAPKQAIFSLLLSVACYCCIDNLSSAHKDFDRVTFANEIGE